MKTKIVAMMLILSLSSPAFADWKDDFKDTFDKQTIELAVENALKSGKSPLEIIKTGQNITNLNIGMLLMALYCAGSDGNDIKTAAEESGISEFLIITAYEKSVNECGGNKADSQAYTPISVSFIGTFSLESNNGSFASPSRF